MSHRNRLCVKPACRCADHFTTLLFRCAVHPKGLDPFQVAKAWCPHKKDGLPRQAVRLQVCTMAGTQPGRMAAEDAVGKVEVQRQAGKYKRTGITSLRYAKCGQKEVPLVVGAEEGSRRIREALVPIVSARPATSSAS